MLLFLISLAITGWMLIERLHFLRLESAYSAGFWGIFPVILYILALLIGVYTFFVDGFKRKPNVKSWFNFELLTKNEKFNYLTLFLVVITTLFLAASFYFNFIKTSLHWDAVALYDARAKFLEFGMTFSDMPSLSVYDNLNKYYYLLYPPFTSIAHYLWRTTPYIGTIPVSLMYSLVLFLLTSIMFLVGREKLGLLAATFLALLVSSNSSIFNVAVKEYTNLPFDLYLVAGIFLLYLYLDGKRQLWKYVFGVLAISSSLWIRLIEPIWLAISIAFIIAVGLDKRRLYGILLGVLMFLFCVVEYVSWDYFIKVLANNPGYLHFTGLKILDMFAGVVSGAWITVGITMAKAWGIPFAIHSLAILGLIFRYKYVWANKHTLFLGLTLILSILIYFFELYVLSFLEDWWSTIAMSIDRSSTFLIPVSGFILFDLLISSETFKKWSRN